MYTKGIKGTLFGLINANVNIAPNKYLKSNTPFGSFLHGESEVSECRPK